MKRTVSKRTVRVADSRELTNTETHTECARLRLHLVHLLLHIIELGCVEVQCADKTRVGVVVIARAARGFLRIHRDDTEGTARRRGSDC